MRLAAIDVDEYVATVLPETAAMWAGERAFEDYAADWRVAAASGYGRGHIRTVGLRRGGVLVASCKLYERALRCGERRLRAVGIGAVFTPPAVRGRGYGRALIDAVLADARERQLDLAYLFSDIDPAFYAASGFIALPSRSFSLRVAPSRSRRGTPLGDADAAAMRRCLARADERRPLAFARSALYDAFTARRHRHLGAEVRFGVRDGNELRAYVNGRRITARSTFVVDELALADPGDTEAALALLNTAGRGLERIAGWLPPSGVREALPRPAVRGRKTAIAMIAALSPLAAAAWRRVANDVLTSRGDPFWAEDHI